MKIPILGNHHKIEFPMDRSHPKHVRIEYIQGIQIYPQNHHHGLDIDGDQDNDNIADWIEEIATDNWAWFTRGYTGHEMLPEFGLINMNGRAYDPVLGRMLQVDNYIQNPFSSQSYNRYSYVLNNPLKYVDPSGELYLIDDLIVGGIGFVAGYVTGGLSTGDWGWSSVKQGLIWGGTAVLALNTMGASFSPSAAAGIGLQGAASNIVSGLLPSIPIYQSEEFSLSVSPTVGFGTSGYTVGAHVNVSGQVGDFVYSASYGIGYNSGVSSLGRSMGAGGYRNYGFFVGGNDGHANYGVGFSNNKFGGDLAQNVSAFTAQIGDFSFRLDEDTFNGTDKYRTGGMLMTYRIDKDLTVAFGAFMMTGMQRGDPIEGGNPKSNEGKGLYTNEDYPNLRAGTFFGGVIYKEQASFVGHNSEKRLHDVQNWIHRNVTGTTPYFPNSNLVSGYYSYFGGYHPNYLFY